MKIYTCPMHPEITSDKPGRCPKCGMDLVPVHDQGEKAHQGHKDHAGMEQDFKRRFFITLPFVVIVVLLSENIQKWLGITIKIPIRQLHYQLNPVIFWLSKVMTVL